eukprot:s1389_g2.t1
MAFGSVDAFGSAAGDTTGISVEAFPTLDTVSKTPAGPTRRWGPVALGESTDIAGLAGGGEFTDPAGFAGGVFGASTATTLGDPTELFPVTPLTGGVFTGGLLTEAEGAPSGAFPVAFPGAFPPVGIGFSFGGGVDGGGSGAGTGGGGGGSMDDGGRQFGGG